MWLAVKLHCNAAQLGTRIVLNEELGEEGSDRFLEHLKHLDLCIIGMILALSDQNTQRLCDSA